MKRTVAVLVTTALLAACSDRELPTGPTPNLKMAKGNSGVLTVTTLADEPAGACTNGSCTLRAAIASAADGDRIVFKNNVAGTVVLTAGSLNIAAAVTIEGNGRIAVDAMGGSPVVAVAHQATQVTLSGLTVTGGYHAITGGGIVNAADLTLVDCVVTGNSTGGEGGGIQNAKGLTLIATTVSNNSAWGGGGIKNGILATATVIASTISGNEASAWGGGIYNTGNLTVSRSTVSGNDASTNGGGLYNTGKLTVSRTTVSGNNSASGVGGIRTTSASGVSASFVSSTITRNTGGGLDTGGLFSGGGIATLTNTIVAGNISSFWPDCEGNVTSFGHNLTRVGTACPTNGSGDVVVNPEQLFTQVLAHELADNGGPTFTHALIDGGRAVDAGYCPGEIVDQRGMARPYDEQLMPNAPDGCDIGAFEWQPAATAQTGKKGKK